MSGTNEVAEAGSSWFRGGWEQTPVEDGRRGRGHRGLGSLALLMQWMRRGHPVMMVRLFKLVPTPKISFGMKANLRLITASPTASIVRICICWRGRGLELISEAINVTSRLTSRPSIKTSITEGGQFIARTGNACLLKYLPWVDIDYGSACARGAAST